MAPAAASAAATDVSTAVQPEALGAWLEAWAAEHGGVEATDVRPGRVTYTAADGARIHCDPPFPPLQGVATGPADGFLVAPIVAHAARERVTGVILVGPRGHSGRAVLRRAAGRLRGRRPPPPRRRERRRAASPPRSCCPTATTSRPSCSPASAARSAW